MQPERLDIIMHRAGDGEERGWLPGESPMGHDLPLILAVSAGIASLEQSHSSKPKGFGTRESTSGAVLRRETALTLLYDQRASPLPSGLCNATLCVADDPPARLSCRHRRSPRGCNPMAI